jgi:two-component system CitB family response regulator
VSHHILIVEDSELAASALRLLIEAMGQRVSVAHTVAAALAVVDRDPPSLILLDLTLPDGSGLRVAHHVGARDAVPIVIAMTGHDADDVLVECRAAGCRLVLPKPVPIRQLREIVHAL